jgi:hypothetical protein
VALSLYLDDCANSDLLARLLQNAGHRVVRPSDVGLDGEEDHVHLAFALAQGLTLITKNCADFKDLHDSGNSHCGILGVYQDNDPSRDMSDADIVRAIGRIEQAAQSGGDPIHSQFHILNFWR